MTADDILDDVLRREGGYVNDSADRGGCTAYGITQATLSGWRGRPVTCAEVKALSSIEARQIYTEKYIKPFQGAGPMNGQLLGLCVDCAVNHGVSRAVKWLQDAAGVKADGVLGPRSREAVQSAQWRVLFTKILRTRLRFYGAIIRNDPKQSKFLLGWMNRASSFLDHLA